ncbi:MAG: DUF995 domain-containing protein [Roseovarius sp.]|nr:DUF995 domain-containing protein [Roseovarius sp.]
MKSKIFTTLCVAASLFATGLSAKPVSGKIYNLQAGWLEQTYRDKTWDWGNGHGYFAPDGTFQAAIGRTQSATGTWYAAKGGKICFQAQWTTEAGTKPTLKCWRHIADQEKNLWQAPLDGGFSFKWAPFDPATQLLPGNIFKSRFDYASAPKTEIPVKELDAQDVAGIYGGKTWKWEDGHAYFGSGGVLTAVSGQNSIGEGNWYSKQKGRICINAIWKGPGFGDVQKESCWLHAKDANGVIWQTPVAEELEWSRFKPDETLVKGNPYASLFNRQKRNLGQ